MREIKFRGLRTDGKGFVIGSLVFRYGKYYICFKHVVEKSSRGSKEIVYLETEVTPETVGQFTGLTDRNGVEIYEGDVVKVLNKPYSVLNSIVTWGVKSHGWSLKCSVIKDNKYNPSVKYYGLGNSKDLEVTSNIHEHGKENI